MCVVSVGNGWLGTPRTKMEIMEDAHSYRENSMDHFFDNPCQNISFDHLASLDKHSNASKPSGLVFKQWCPHARAILMKYCHRPD